MNSGLHRICAPNPVRRWDTTSVESTETPPDTTSEGFWTQSRFMCRNTSERVLQTRPSDCRCSNCCSGMSNSHKERAGRLVPAKRVSVLTVYFRTNSQRAELRLCLEMTALHHIKAARYNSLKPLQTQQSFQKSSYAKLPVTVCDNNSEIRALKSSLFPRV